MKVVSRKKVHILLFSLTYGPVGSQVDNSVLLGQSILVSARQKMANLFFNQSSKLFMFLVNLSFWVQLDLHFKAKIELLIFSLSLLDKTFFSKCSLVQSKRNVRDI